MPDDRRPQMRTFARLLARLARDRAGNTLMLIAAAILPIMAMVGGGVDMGRSYLSQNRLQQACDAGVLAARKKLGSQVVANGNVPGDVAATGNRFFNLNFRDGAYGSANRQFAMAIEANYAISGRASIDLPTAIMGIFGYDNMAIAVQCQARLNFGNTDVMMVLDTTGSMRDTNPGDSDPKIDVLRRVVKSFATQLEGSKSPGTRIRYGFVPYSTNVNVGGLLKDDWVVDRWSYQSRVQTGTKPSTGTRTDRINVRCTANCSAPSSRVSTYTATYHPPAAETGGAYYSCDTSPPRSTGGTRYTLVSTTNEPYVGPPAGTKQTKHYRAVTAGSYYWISLNGTTCEVWRVDYSNYTQEFDDVTTPSTSDLPIYTYLPIERDVTNWRAETSGCMEERGTYEIRDYNNVDLSRALDLDIDTVPTPGNPATQWRPMYTSAVFERKIKWDGSGNFDPKPVVTDDDYIQPAPWGLTACPAAARKLAEMSASQVGAYVDTLQPAGSTYHDIGMIWGGRLLSPTGIFADENADVGAQPTSRNLIFLTDGLTAPLDLSYGTYGVEPLDQRRWTQKSKISLTQLVENRFTVACSEVKKRNITVWVIGFGTSLNSVLTQCAGSGHFYEATDAAQLNDVFSKIAAQLGDLRVSK